MSKLIISFIVLIVLYYYLRLKPTVIPIGVLGCREGDIVLIAGEQCKVLKVFENQQAIKVRKALFWEKIEAGGTNEQKT